LVPLLPRTPDQSPYTSFMLEMGNSKDRPEVRL
jgi:hypothetical protein